VVGGVGGIALIAGALTFFLLRRKRASKGSSEESKRLDAGSEDEFIQDYADTGSAYIPLPDRGSSPPLSATTRSIYSSMSEFRPPVSIMQRLRPYASSYSFPGFLS
jgi:hypothetical protein